MSGVAWQIPLSAGQNIPEFGPDPQKLLNEQVTAAKLAEFNQQQQGRNALKQLYANPANFGPDGRLTPQALRTLGTTDPSTAIDLQSSLVKDDVAQTQLSIAKAKFGDQAISASIMLGKEANAAYDDAAKSGGPAAGQAAGTQVWSQGLSQLGAAGYPPEFVNGIQKNYDRNRIGRIVSASDQASLTPEQVETKQEHAVTEAQGEERLTIEQQRANVDVDKEKREAANAGKGEWAVLTDPGRTDDKGNQVQYRYNATTAKSTTLSGDPYTPTGAAKVGQASGGQPASQTEVDYWTRVLNNGGVLPPGLARTKQGSDLVRQIMANVPDSGTDPGDFIANHAQAKANASSLGNMTKMADAATSFERTARQNFDYALSLAPEGVPTDWGPWLNRWIENGETQAGVTGVPAYVTAMLTAANEYAKIMSGSTGSVGSSQDSRREAAELFSPYLSQGQIKAVVAVAEGDMDRRKSSLYGQVSDIRDRLKGGEAPGAEASEHPDVVQNGWRYKWENGKYEPDSQVK